MDYSRVILVRITASTTNPWRFRLKVSSPAQLRTDEGWTSAAYELQPDAAPTVSAVTPNDLATALLEPSNPAIERLRALLASDPGAPVLLDLRARYLESVAWEALLDVPAFAPSWNPATKRPLIRYSPQLADMALMPLSLPVNVLLAEFTGWPPPADEQFPHPLKHFRAMTATRLDAERLYSLLRSTSFDIVHLRARTTRDDSILRIPEPGGALNLEHAAVLRRLLSVRGCSARLVILETDEESMPTAREIGHRVLGRAGPTVIVTPTARFDFRQFYDDLTHDEDISAAFHGRARTAGAMPQEFDSRPGLMMARRGEEVLKISSVEETIQHQAAAQAQRAAAVLAEYVKWRPVEVQSWSDRHLVPSFESVAPRDRQRQSYRRLTELADANRLIADVQNRQYLYHAESAGMEPLELAAAELAQATAVLATHEAQLTRVVNTWFQREGNVVLPSSSLAAGGRYQLHVRVGPRMRQTNIREPVAIPEEELEPFYADEGVPVRVVLFSTDFEVPVPEATMDLPRPPGASEPLVLDVIAPSREGPAWLRVGLYYRNNLLQSILITATITEAESRGRGTGNRGEVEWVLSGSLSDLERFEEKRVSILTNETPGGTHLLAVVGAGIRQQLELGEAELIRKVDEARGALQWVSGDPNKGEEYRFEPDNRGDKEGFRNYLAGLAEFGYDLYADLVTGQDPAFMGALSQALSTPATIQAVWMKSAKRVFPWALVYDLPLEPNEANQVCPDFLQALEQGAGASDLETHPCFAKGCAYAEDTNIICPSGFWGFRHVIEQPLSTKADKQAGDAPAVGSPAADAVATISATGRAEILLGYSENLERCDEHRQEILLLPTARTVPHSDLVEIRKGLQRVDLNVVYFYCHGGNKRGKAWLGVGGDPPDTLYATNLLAWRVSWPVVRPLVFINGCNTVGITPDDLLTFNQMFAWCKAAGVIGTEITIHETLGEEFGSRFLAGFLAGEQVGALIRRLRLELLAEYNPLGLAYTPYCLANLHLEVN